MTTCDAPITVTPTDGDAFHTGRRLHRVECAAHGLIHPGTTGPEHHSESHRRTGEAWPVDRPAPTPAPGLDLDAVEAAERAMTAGPWRHVEVLADGELIRDEVCDADCNIGGAGADFQDVNAAGIVALRNAAPALIAEVRALRVDKDALVKHIDYNPSLRIRELADARAEIARLTAERDAARDAVALATDRHNYAVAQRDAVKRELAAARAVPADVEAAIESLRRVAPRLIDREADAAQMFLGALDHLRTAIARAISDATFAAVGEFIDGHARRLCEQAGESWDVERTKPGCWPAAVREVLDMLVATPGGLIIDGRPRQDERATARATVGGLLATARCSKCRGISSHTPGGIPCDECGLVGSMPWGG